MRQFHQYLLIVLCLLLLFAFCCCNSARNENSGGNAGSSDNDEALPAAPDIPDLTEDNPKEPDAQHDTSDPRPDEPAPAEDTEEPFYLRGAWIPTVFRLSYPSAYTTDANVLRKDLNDIISTAKELNVNALFFQVRPSGDSFYPSDIFPWSQYLSGIQGQAPSGNFDPLRYMLSACHQNGIQLHAWINPFRITASAASQLIETHPVYDRSDLTLSVGGKLYLNPGEPNARQLVLMGVREVLEKYKVDGIHYDDYFYPEGAFDDSDTFSRYGEEFTSINDWRRNNIDLLIEETQALVKEIAPDALFGVSPPGVWANKINNAFGSDTLGFESYYAIFADSRNWVKRQLVDYIAPQIYWERGNTLCDFNVLLDWWKGVVASTSVQLVPGLAAYKADDSRYPAFQSDKNEISAQIQLCKTEASGFILYSFSDLAAKAALQEAVRQN